MNEYAKESKSDKKNHKEVIKPKNKLNIDDVKLKTDIYSYTKDAFIQWNKKENKVKLIGGLVNNIFNTSKSSIELTKEEVKVLLDEKSGILFEKCICSITTENEVNEFILKSRENKKIYWFKSISKRVNSYKDGYSCVGLLKDITLQKQNEIDNCIMNYDITTGIANKNLMKNVINKYLYENEKYSKLGALFLIDLDNFNFINDLYDYEVGDKLLYSVANHLRLNLNDNSVIGRFAADQFIVFKPQIESVEEAGSIAKQIIKILESPINVDGNNFYVTGSIGVALSPHDGNDFNMLLKSADIAMHSVKEKGKNGYEFFKNKTYIELNKVFGLRRCLKRALKDNEMYVVFQPIISLIDYKMHEMESLIRWNSKELGMVPPNQFIPLSETTRQIIPIGKFVLEEVFKKIRELLDLGYNDFKIAVNLSELQLRHKTIIKDIKELMNKYDVSLKYIKIEITESILMKSYNENISILNEIRKLGGSVALDDFGTGYSSLNYLTKLPIDILKIDRSFIVDLVDNEKNRCIVRNIINLSHELGIEVVAEGVEDIEQVNYLKSINCDKIQGYYFSKPDHFENIKKLFYKKFS